MKGKQVFIDFLFLICSFKFFRNKSWGKLCFILYVRIVENQIYVNFVLFWYVVLRRCIIKIDSKIVSAIVFLKYVVVCLRLFNIYFNYIGIVNVCRLVFEVKKYINKCFVLIVDLQKKKIEFFFKLLIRVMEIFFYIVLKGEYSNLLELRFM